MLVFGINVLLLEQTTSMIETKNERINNYEITWGKEMDCKRIESVSWQQRHLWEENSLICLYWDYVYFEAFSLVRFMSVFFAKLNSVEMNEILEMNWTVTLVLSKISLRHCTYNQFFFFVHLCLTKWVLTRKFEPHFLHL